MGYEVDVQTIESYAQHLLTKLDDPQEPKFGTFKEKDMELHKKFTQPERKRKVTKMVEAVAEKMGFTRESIKKAKEKKAQMEAEMESKNPKTKSVPSKENLKETKSSPAPMKPSPHSTTQRSFEKGVLKKKEKPKITYVAISHVASETESDEEAEKEKKKGEFV
ncbi:uncharacterized protein LOC131075547 [Cryptomeria japonica]|uniref:uncharacterized protein LOC131075547 n=1 Tax=Cryptomeria japonica TaxID=3369 RepID=UPI0025AC4618|nr:uncharacterized protein LOC131075547 [Cryptomeria japonica]